MRPFFVNPFLPLSRPFSPSSKSHTPCAGAPEDGQGDDPVPGAQGLARHAAHTHALTRAATISPLCYALHHFMLQRRSKVARVEKESHEGEGRGPFTNMCAIAKACVLLRWCVYCAAAPGARRCPGRRGASRDLPSLLPRQFEVLCCAADPPHAAVVLLLAAQVCCGDNQAGRD